MSEPERQKKTPRKHVTTACVPCRESKVKCDGGSPVCENCKNRSRECQYQHGADKRKVSLRAAIELLSARVDQLHQFLHDNGLEAPAMDEDDAMALASVLNTLRIANPEAKQKAKTSDQSRKSEILRSDSLAGSKLATDLATKSQVKSKGESPDSFGAARPLLSEPRASGFPDMARPGSIDSNFPLEQRVNTTSYSSPDWNFGLLPAGESGGQYVDLGRVQNFPNTSDPQVTGVAPEAPSTDLMKPPSSHPTHASEDEGGNEGEAELIEQLSARIGSLQLTSDGQLRYYGPTSNFNLLDVSATEPLPDGRSIRHDGQDLLDHLKVGQYVDPALEDHLTDLYFAWQDPCLHVVDKTMYTAAKKQWRSDMDDTPYYSEVLTNAMCALGSAFEARYHPTFITFPKSLAEFFADRAKALLEIELDCPNVATVQALVILSCHEAASKRDARGWLYSGMSMRVAFDLGLHIDMTPYIEKGSVSVEEAEVRRIAFWGSYMIDHHWGFYLGRPFRVITGDVTVKKPGSDPAPPKATRWYPYGYSGPQSQMQTSELPDLTELVARNWIWLCEKVSPHGQILYGNSQISKLDLEELNTNTTAELFAWMEHLTPALRVDYDDEVSAYLPHVLMLHMQYHQFVIFLHRPWVSKHYIQPSPPRGAGYLHARKTCIESATAVAKLLRLYEKRYTFRRVNSQVVAIIFTAALILVFATVSHSNRTGSSMGIQFENKENVAHLNVCFRALDELGQSFENAKRTRQFLVSLQRRWHNRVRAATAGAKRVKSNPQLSQMAGADGASGSDSLATFSNKKHRKSLSGRFDDGQTGQPLPFATYMSAHQPEPIPQQGQATFLDGLGLEWMCNDDLQLLSENQGQGMFQTMPDYADGNLFDPSDLQRIDPTNGMFGHLPPH